MNLVEWSLFVEKGLQRPPLVRASGKKPLLDAGWTTGPFEDPDSWREKLRNHKGNVGCLTGRGRLAIDVDRYKVGAEGSFDALVADTGLSTSTVTAITGHQGAHFWYACPIELAVPSVPLAPLGYPGIEVKADGGQVIVEPSIHPETNQQYQWEIGFAPGDVEVVEVPKAFLVLIGALRGKSRRSGRWHPLSDEEMAELDPRDLECARLLCEHFGGHDPAWVHGQVAVWRPGKAEGGASATIGFIGPGVVKMWSSHWEPFEQYKVYDVGQLRDMAGLSPKITVPEAPLELPEGYRLWRPGDDDRPNPVLASTARYGPLGELLTLLEDQVEVNVAPIGAMFLVDVGTLIGRHAAVRIGEHRHHANLFLLVVGETSIGGKGSADEAVERCITDVEKYFFVRHVVGGFGSGEAVIYEVRDTKDDEEPVEKRRVISEPEFSRVLRVAQRDQSILSQIIRQGFDYRPLQHRTKTQGTLISTGHHLSVIGSITPNELAACSSELDIENGWLNRFMFAHSELVRVLPFGGHIDTGALDAVMGQVRRALDELDGRPMAEYFITEGTDVGRLWGPWYSTVRFGNGSVPALTRRQHVHVARLALILAVLDGASAITVEHLSAAMAWSDYSTATVERLFGHVATGKAAQLLQAIREAGADGLDGKGQDQVFHSNLRAGALAEMREDLEGRYLIASVTHPTGGRPRLVSYAIAPLGATEKRKNGKRMHP